MIRKTLTAKETWIENHTALWNNNNSLWSNRPVPKT